MVIDTITSSPEFEFKMARNPSFPQPNILSADQLFLDGVLLPLHLRPTQTKPAPQPKPPQPDPEPPSPAIIPRSAATTASKRWKDIFRKSDKKNAQDDNDKDKANK